MTTTPINRFRFGGFVGACAAAVLVFMSGDVATAGGIIAAVPSATGGKQR